MIVLKFFSVSQLQNQDSEIRRLKHYYLVEHICVQILCWINCKNQRCAVIYCGNSYLNTEKKKDISSHVPETFLLFVLFYLFPEIFWLKETLRDYFYNKFLIPSAKDFVILNSSHIFLKMF